MRRETPFGHVFGHACLVDSLAEKSDFCPVWFRTLAV